ncbi:MAG TPA: hypothetical protein VGN11_13220 [Candidatus Baltobacteraceae bacterium]|nr:hypothetical protein [Candidatus Baltobacteraceae bacterium]
MPKRFLIACAIAASALAACSGYNPTSIFGTPTTPTPIPSYSPNPAITSALVTLSVSGSPVPNVPIIMSTPDPNGQAGAPIATVTTDSTGTSKFTSLNPTATYCWQAMYTPPGGPAPQQYSICTLYWQSGIRIGNP